MSRPSIHCSIYGPAGTGKSFFAASFTPDLTGGPELVWMFDPRGKDSAYWEDAASSKEGTHVIPARGPDLVIPYVDLFDAKGSLLRRVEYMHEDSLDFMDENVEGQDYLDARGWNVLLKIRKRVSMVLRDESEFWRTIVWDSTTSSALSFLNYHRFEQNRTARGEAQKKWWGASTDEHEKFLAVRFAGFPGNVIIISHTDKDKTADESGGVLRYTPRLPGRLANDMGTYYTEMYHSFVQTADDGEPLYQLQTRPNDLYGAHSQTCKAPNPCPNEYRYLWLNWDKAHAKEKA